MSMSLWFLRLRGTIYIPFTRQRLYVHCYTLSVVQTIFNWSPYFIVYSRNDNIFKAAYEITQRFVKQWMGNVSKWIITCKQCWLTTGGHNTTWNYVARWVMRQLMNTFWSNMLQLVLRHTVYLENISLRSWTTLHQSSLIFICHSICKNLFSVNSRIST